jgi:hypothetical protein
MIVQRVRYGSRGQGSLVRHDDSPNWFSCYYVHGKEHRESTGTPDLKKARSWHKAKLDEIGAGRRGLTLVTTPASKRVTVGELLDALEADYRLRGVKSSAQIKSHLKPVSAHFGDWRAVDITAEAADAYIEARLEADKAPATVNRETQLLSQAMRLALTRQRITTILPAIRHLPEQNARQGFFERPEFEAVVTALPDSLRDFARFGYFTGWRRGEIISLTWSRTVGPSACARSTQRTGKLGLCRSMSCLSWPLSWSVACERGCSPTTRGCHGLPSTSSIRTGSLSATSARPGPRPASRLACTTWRRRLTAPSGRFTRSCSTT